MKFKNYLDNQIQRKDRIGDLAKRLKNRKDVSYEDMYSYLYSVEASDEEIFALKAAFEEFNQVGN